MVLKDNIRKSFAYCILLFSVFLSIQNLESSLFEDYLTCMDTDKDNTTTIESNCLHSCVGCSMCFESNRSCLSCNEEYKLANVEGNSYYICIPHNLECAKNITEEFNSTSVQICSITNDSSINEALIPIVCVSAVVVIVLVIVCFCKKCRTAGNKRVSILKAQQVELQNQMNYIGVNTNMNNTASVNENLPNNVMQKVNLNNDALQQKYSKSAKNVGILEPSDNLNRNVNAGGAIKVEDQQADVPFQIKS